MKQHVIRQQHQRCNCFLQEEVVDRAVRVKTSKRKVGVVTVEMYVNTISDLYSDQQSRDVNLHRHPRNSLIKQQGGSAGNMEIPDLFSVILEHEGYTECRALVMIMEQGKTYQYGRREFGSCIRHQNLEMCPVGALDYYLFYRWSVQNEDVPNFLVPEEWYEAKVLKAGKNRTTPLTYRVHYDANVNAFTALGIHSKSKTHAARGSVSRRLS
ncbi:hypothetical protein PHMEG_00013660 [Phytophthora megakarya]|uniref:Ndc10 domain-containing protein n=1 Tax=Phytophthora megakarya TaxID=4795 RepID=A0A225W674_9STRA|nr:hypothetical protein PHMEG_00013660 [Phytophthora megakarya]